MRCPYVHNICSDVGADADEVVHGLRRNDTRWISTEFR